MIRTIALGLFCLAIPALAQDDWEPRQAAIDLQESLGLGEGDWQLRSSWGRGAAAPAQAVGTAWAQSTRLYWKGKEAGASLALQTDAFEQGLDHVGFSVQLRKWYLGDMQLFIGQGLVWGQGQSMFGGLQPIRLELYPQLLQTYRGVREGFAFRGIGHQSAKGPYEWGCLLGQRKWDARWQDDHLASIDRSGQHQTPASVERKGNLSQHSFLVFGSRSWIRNGPMQHPHWRAGTAFSLSRFSAHSHASVPWLMAGSVWASGPLGLGTVSVELSQEGPKNRRAIAKYSQALSKWTDWGLEFSRVPENDDARLGLDAYEDLTSGLSGKMLLVTGPRWNQWQWVSQWSIAPGPLQQADWQHRLSKSGELRKAKAGQLSVWKLEIRFSGQAAQARVQGRAQLRWALPSPLQNRYFQIKAQVSPSAIQQPFALDLEESKMATSGQLSGTFKWGKQSLGLVCYRGPSLQWAALPSLPYQSSWRVLSGNGICISACCRRPIGRKAELHLQALYQSPSPSEASLLRMFAQVQWKA